MPSQRLIAMGVLSRYPNRSSVMKKFLNPYPGMKYTEYEKMHITALYFTPGLSERWIMHQFKGKGRRMIVMRRISAANREKYEAIGKRNVLFMGKAEVLRFFQRAPPRTQIPIWAVAVFQQYVKEGVTKTEIARMHGLNRNSVNLALKRNIFWQPEDNRIARFGDKINHKKKVDVNLSNEERKQT